MAEAERWRDLAHKMLDLAAEGATTDSPLAAPACEAPVTPPNPEWRWLSPLEEQILAVVNDQYRPADDLAKSLKLKCSSDFRMVLRNLVARQILDSSGEGYRIRRPPAG